MTDLQMTAGMCPSFPLPRTKKFSFHQTISSKDPAITLFLENASAIRNGVAEALSTGDPDMTISAIDAYLPILQGVQELAVRSNDLISTHGQVCFTWTSACDKKPGKIEYTLYGWQFEATMVLSALAYARASKAAALAGRLAVEDDFESVARQIAALYRSAAGIGNHIAEKVLPIPGSLPFSRPPEIMADLHRAISSICRCAVQQVCIRQAHRRGLPQLLISRLNLGAAALLSSANAHLEAMTADKKDLSPPLRYYAAGGGPHLTAVALRFAGRAAWEAGQYGEGLAIMREAKARMDAALSAGLMHAPWPSLHERVAADMAAGKSDLQLFEKDNRTVYFAVVPALPSPPEPAYAASDADNFDPPPPASPLPPPPTAFPTPPQPVEPSAAAADGEDPGPAAPLPSAATGPPR